MTYRLMAVSFMFVLTLGLSIAVAEDIGGVSSDSPAVAAPEAPAVDAAQAPVAADSATDAAAGAQADPESAPVDGEGQPEKPGGFNLFLLMGAVILIFMFFMSPGKKAEKKRKEMLANLKKNDRVTTIGGIVGTVLEVRENEVTIKVDEGTNAKMKVARWAIREIGRPEGDVEPDQR